MDRYKKNPGYRRLQKELLRRYGGEISARIWSSANDKLEQLYKTHANIPDSDKVHAFNGIFLRIAMYRALQDELPEDAMPLLEQAVRESGKQVSGILRFLTSAPGMSSLFLRVFERMAKEKFGPSAGFSQRFYPAGRGELRFDITACPYDRYCRLCGCPELTHTFCDSDIYCYGDLPHIRFARTQTIGTGGECCDFYLKLQHN